MRIIRAIVMYYFHPERWENVCLQCGLCCYERTVSDTGEMAIDLASPCEFLDVETNLCRVYPERFERCPRCTQITPREAFSKYFLPPNCAYRNLFR